MKLGLYTESLKRTITGVENVTQQLVYGMKDKHEVICYHTNKSPILDGVKNSLFLTLPIPFFNRAASFFRTKCFDECEILHVPYPDFPYMWKPKAKVIVTVHDITPVTHPQFHTLKRKIYFKYFLPYYLRGADKIIVSSEATKNELITHYGVEPRKLERVYLGVNIDQYKEAKKEEYILYLGTIESRKNIIGIINAFSKLKKEGLPHKLVLAGRKSWDSKDVFKLIKTLGLTDFVEYKGYVNEEEKRELLSRASVFVWPSFVEGFGLPLVEAMASGTPVVTSNCSTMPEVVGDAGVLVDPNSPEDIARGIKEALEDNSLIGKGKERAKKFTVEKMIENINKVYEEL